MKIKSLLLLLIIFIIANKNVFAQRFKAGIIAGAVATDVDGVDPSDNDFFKAGFTVGGLVSRKLSEKSSIQFEILYTTKGSLQPADSANNYNFYQLHLNYVEVPVMFKRIIKFNINKKPVERFYIEAGPSFGRLVSFNEEYNGVDYTSGNFNNYELAINLGVGCVIVKNLSFNVRYSNSLIPVVNHPVVVNSFSGYTFNKGNSMVFSFTLRYIFDLQKKGDANPS
jgi:hypothetical protein